MLTEMFEDPTQSDMPRPFGVFYKTDRPIYEQGVIGQIENAKSKWGEGDLDELLQGKFTWDID